MTRLARIVILAVTVLGLAAAAGWWWWSRPPLAPVEVLAASLAQAPADADGAVVLAAPKQFGRWLATHRQSAALLLVAAPEAGRAARRMERPILACALAARGPLVLWWRGGDLAVAADVDAGARRGLAKLAGLANLAAGERGASFALATAPELLDTSHPANVPEVAGDHASALALIGGRLWVAVAGRRRLDAISAGGADLPAPAEPSEIATAAIGRLLAAGGVGAEGLTTDARVIAEERLGWGIALPGLRISGTARRLLGLGPDGGDGGGAAHRITGPFGELWVELDGDSAVGSSEPFLRRVRAIPAGEHGSVRGDDAAWLLAELGSVLERLPGLAGRGRTLSGTGGTVRGLRRARWRITAAGGTIAMEW